MKYPSWLVPQKPKLEGNVTSHVDNETQYGAKLTSRMDTERKYGAKLTEAEQVAIREMVNDGFSLYIISREMRRSSCTIKRFLGEDTPPMRHQKAKAVMIDGKIYYSIAEAAKETGLTTWMIAKRVQRGEAKFL